MALRNGIEAGRALRRPLLRVEDTTMTALAPRLRRVGEALPARWLSPLLWAAWLPFAIPPTAALLRSHDAAAAIAAGVGGLVLFFAVYLWAAWDNPLTQRFTSPPNAAPTSATSWPIPVLTALGVVMTIAFGSGWVGLFIFTSASVGPRFRTARAAWTVVGLTVLAFALGLATQAGLLNAAQAALLVGGIGLSVVLLSHSVRTVLELRAARAEVARLAVAEERLRFARDLHDLLGHSLSLIALKCDLARQLAPVAPERAAREIADAETVAREALREVREAVAGYRQTSVAAEIAGAREVLAAAGIALEFEGPRAALPAAIETVFAWAVREGVTNIVRHSRAHRCTIRLAQDDDQTCLEIVDDGIGARERRDTVEQRRQGGGHGLAGLAERASSLGGRCEAGPGADGGFRLAVWLPRAEAQTNAAGSVTHTEAAPA